ncbi:5'-nucleotidase [Acinetobacter calcoaceticus]|uniref:5'-nucleotidase n=1 Tax=Acinetobacter calcoaceticus TaxID=471 RepID=A0A4R1Y2V3_ACICA|nr:5'-nucleotidase [Acinetobacter calcoaceticus]
MKKVLAVAVFGLMASQSFALNILISNDDGLSSNVKALTTALRAAGHSVVVSVPCTGQSGRSAGIVMYSDNKISALNDDQITKNAGCLNGVAAVGDPAVGAFKKAGYPDYHYVHGTPVLSVMYGIDAVAQNKWGKLPDLILSGPNEGQNIGSLSLFSGTVGVVQYAGSRGIPAIAISAGQNTVDNKNLANPLSTIVANHTVKLIAELQSKAQSGKILPARTVLNVNFPDKLDNNSRFAFSKMGSYDAYYLKFKTSVPYGITAGKASTGPNGSQQQDEMVVSANNIAVTAMQVGFDSRPATQEWLKLRLRQLLGK